MAAPEQYLLDANVFIEAHRRYYAFDLCPGFWESLIHLNGLGRIHSIQRVKDEFTGDDALSKWVATVAPASFFYPDDGEDVQVMFGNMMTWVMGNPQFNDSAKSEFASVADGWLMAYAKVYGLTLVTHEVFARDAKKKVPMPNVCQAFGVDYVNTFEMLQRLSVKFHWGP